MKRILAPLLILTTLLSACKSDDKIAPPVDVWTDQCANLTSVDGAYRLSGMCCEYLNFPLVKLRMGKTVHVTGSYHGFTGAGFSDIPVTIQLQVDPGGRELKLSYSIGDILKEYKLIADGPVVLCDCYCD
jgi:hypothetical protein